MSTFYDEFMLLIKKHHKNESQVLPTIVYRLEAIEAAAVVCEQSLKCESIGEEEQILLRDAASKACQFKGEIEALSKHLHPEYYAGTPQGSTMPAPYPPKPETGKEGAA